MVSEADLTGRGFPRPYDSDLAAPRARGLSCRFRPLSIRGRRECRAPDAPASRVCRGSGCKHTR